jgi:hypothetical protein
MNVDFDIKDAFLVGACRMGHGDIKKMIKVVEVCKAMHLSLTDEEIEQILSQLRIEDSMKDGVMITRKGYYYAIKISRESVTNFGMVSFNEARKLSFCTLQYVCKQSHVRKTESRINILEINHGGREGGPYSYGKEVI